MHSGGAPPLPAAGRAPPPLPAKYPALALPDSAAMRWRSALACQIATKMGLERAAHLDGGFKGWKDAGGEVVPYEKKK